VLYDQNCSLPNVCLTNRGTPSRLTRKTPYLVFKAEKERFEEEGMFNQIDA
jgi:hypothetical protein